MKDENFATKPIISSGDDYVDLPEDAHSQLDDFIPTDVCHYTTRATGKIILKTGNLRLSKLVNTNDPVESKTRLFSDTEWKTDTGFWYKAGESFEDQLLSEWMVLCFSCNKDPIKQSFMNADYRRLYTYNHNVFGVGYSNMWAHYGENHKGICLLFNGKELDKTINDALDNTRYIVKHGFVRYDDYKAFLPVKRNDPKFEDCGEEERIRKTLIKNYKDNFLYKSTEWKPEHEFRWLVHSTNSLTLDIPIKSAIRAVVLGADFPDKNVRQIKKLCFNLGTRLSRIGWVGGKPEVNFYYDTF